jgi:hypothetical protein
MLGSDSLQIFYGEATQARARIYARALREAVGGGGRLGGTVTGPHNALAATLPATVPLRDLGNGPTWLAEAILPDPCFWSSDCPALYDINVTLRDEHGQTREIAHRQLGLRALGVRGASFYQEGKRWVLRAVDRRCDPDAALATWREAWAAMVVNAPEDALCEQASRLGVVLVAWLRGTRSEVERELRRLGRWAAVSMAVIECIDPLDAAISQAAPNILLGSYLPAVPKEPAVPREDDGALTAPWASCVFAEVDLLDHFAARIARCQLPIVAMHSPLEVNDVQAARDACDTLQRRLAPVREFAGYVTLAASESA